MSEAVCPKMCEPSTQSIARLWLKQCRCLESTCSAIQNEQRKDRQQCGPICVCVCVRERVPRVCVHVCAHKGPQGAGDTSRRKHKQRPSLFHVFPASGAGSGEAELVGGPLGHPETGIPVAPWGPLEQKPPPAQGQGPPGSSSSHVQKSANQIPYLGYLVPTHSDLSRFRLPALRYRP